MNLRLFLSVCLILTVSAFAAEPLPRTALLTTDGDLAAQMVSGLDHYLNRTTAESIASRRRHWQFDSSSSDAFLKSYLASAETNRARLRELLGVVDQREPVTMRFVATVGTNLTQHPGEVARGSGYRVFAVAWNVFRGVEGEGLLLVPDGEPKADVIAVPDCDWTPEQAIGLAPGVPA